MKSAFFYQFPIGTLTIAADNFGICQISFGKKYDLEQYKFVQTPLIQKAARQLTEYFSEQRKDFDLPLSPYGTDFQKSVWQALCTIPYGETRSYQDIAAQIGNPQACRAVGMANNRNPISIIIPCHRVIGKNGNLTGYGSGLSIKQALLELEQQQAN